MTSLRISLVLVLSLVAASASADATSGAYRKFKGQIVVAQDALRTDYPNDREMIAALTKARKTTLPLTEGSEHWDFSLMGFLSKKPGTSPINLVFYDLKGGKRTYVSNREINIDPEGTIVVADLQISEDDGVKAGGKYELVLGVMVNGKETVFAKTKLTLK